MARRVPERGKAAAAQKPATAAQLAALTFEPWPEAAQAMGGYSGWMDRAKAVGPTVILATELLRFSDAELTVRTRGAIASAMTLADAVEAQHEAFTALANMLDAANLRLRVALTRIGRDPKRTGLRGTRRANPKPPGGPKAP